jgi:hypothetical protein
VRVVGRTEDFVVTLQVSRIDRQIRFAKSISPASRRRATGHASSIGTNEDSSSAPEVVRIRAVWKESLIVIGTPCSDPHFSRRASRASATSASARARSASIVATQINRLVERLNTFQEIFEGFPTRNSTLADLLCDCAGICKFCHRMPELL